MWENVRTIVEEALTFFFNDGHTHSNTTVVNFLEIDERYNLYGNYVQRVSKKFVHFSLGSKQKQ